MALAQAVPDTLTEIATNLTGEYANRTCCIVGIRGSLVRDEPAIARALTQSLLDAAHRWRRPGSGRGRLRQVRRRGLGRGSHRDAAGITPHQPVGDELKENIRAYAEELKQVSTSSSKTPIRWNSPTGSTPTF